MSIYHEWLAKIRENEKQWEAFQKGGHTVVIAGPGSGKTRVLAVKIAQLLRDEISAPRGVACLTYTRMMAKELETRLESLGILDRPNVVVGTVHSFCLGHVVEPFAEVFGLDTPQPIRIAPVRVWNSCLDQARREVMGIGYDPKIKKDRDFKTEITKYHLQNIDIPLEEWKNQVYARVLWSHYQLLHEQGYVDFDLIVKAALSLIASQDLVRKSLYAKFAWLAVDEYQDLGYPLFRIVTEMIEHTPIKLFAIGDPDQSIFDFAGTDPKYLKELTERPEMKPVIKLAKNYRATSEVIAISKAVLSPYCDYYSEKNGGACRIFETHPYEQGGLVATLAQKYLDRGVAKNRIAILHPWRENGLHILAKDLEAAEVEFTLDKSPYYDRSMNLIKWLENLGYWCLEGLRFHGEASENQSFDDLVITWSRIARPQVAGGEQDSQARLLLAELIWSIEGADMHLGEWLSLVTHKLDFNQNLEEYQRIFPDEVDELVRVQQLVQPDGELSEIRLRDFVNLSRGIQLTTLHSSKGMEFEVVIIAGVERIWNDENGRRLLYVGVTRAEREVCLVYSKVWPEWSPRTPLYIENLVKKCGHLSYFSYHPLRLQ